MLLASKRLMAHAGLVLIALSWASQAETASSHATDSAYPWSGLPALQRYPPGVRPGGQQSFAITQTPDGEVLVANIDGVLRYFGGRWSQLELPEMNTTRSLGVTPDGKIYVGGYHHFGRLERSDSGLYRLEDLDELFFPDNLGAPLAEVWEILPDANGVYFGTNSTLFWVANDGQHRSWEIGGTGSATSFRVGAEIWVRREDRVMLALQGGELVPRFSDVPSMAWIGKRQSDGQVIALMHDGRFHQLHNGQFVPLSTPSDAILGQSSPYCVLPLSDGSLVVGTLSGEVFHFDPTLTLANRWAVSAFPILALGLDRENGVWLATDNEVIRLDLSPRWSLLGPDRGFRGTLLDGGLYGSEVLLATSMGLYIDQGGGALELVGLEGRETGSIQRVANGALIASAGGLYAYAKGELQPVIEGADALYVVASKKHADVAYVVEDSGLLIVANDGDGWSETQRIIDPAYRFLSLDEDRDGHLWAGQVGDAPMHIRLSTDGRSVIDATRRELGLSRPVGTDSSTFVLAGEIYATTSDGIFRWANDRFLPGALPELARSVGDRLTETFVAECADGQVYAGTTRLLLRRERDRWETLPPMEGQALGIGGFDCGVDGDRFVTTWSGLARFRADAPVAQAYSANPMMESVQNTSAELSVRLALTPSVPPSVDAGSSMRFRFALPTFDQGWRMQTRLSPQESFWSDDPGLGMREVTLQSPGEFELQVRAIRGQGAAGEILRYQFEVVPRWYQAGWIRLIVLLCLLALVALLVRWRLAQLTARNNTLERTVSERTAALELRTDELEKANQRLRELADQDGLTGVANRRRLSNSLEHAFADATERKQNLSVLMIDLDRFKEFNDRYGHLRGDDELRRAAQQMQSALTWKNGLLARYGGEEFVIVLPDADLQQALSQAASIRAALHNDDPQQQQLTVSIGVAELRSHGATTAENLLDQADQGLYLAKGAGRDRIEIYRR